MSTVTATIEGVYGPNEHGFYDIKADGKKFSTKKSNIAERAKEFHNRQATLEYTEKQNGQYTNYYLENVTAPGGGGPSGSSGTGSRGMSPEDVLRVTRLSAVSSAATLLNGTSTDAETLFKIADAIVAYAYRGRPGSTTNAYSEPEPVQVPLSAADDDIPF